jgi:hypothetical protein
MLASTLRGASALLDVAPDQDRGGIENLFFLPGMGG